MLFKISPLFHLKVYNLLQYIEKNIFFTLRAAIKVSVFANRKMRLIIYIFESGNDFEKECNNLKSTAVFCYTKLTKSHSFKEADYFEWQHI